MGNTDTEKKCSTCKTLLDRSMFYKQKDKKDGMRHQCKVCVNSQINAYRKTDEFKRKERLYFDSDVYKARIKKRNSTEKYKTYLKAYVQTDLWKQHQKEWKKLYHQTPRFKEEKRKRYYSDMQYRLSQLLRNRLRNAIGQNHKSGSGVRDLGCSIALFKEYLASKFSDGMSWENYGLWHIDHVVPLARFNLAKKSDIMAAAHYSNLQPMWAKENLSKGSRI